MHMQVSPFHPAGQDLLVLATQSLDVANPIKASMEATISIRANEIEQLKSRVASLMAEMQQASQGYSVLIKEQQQTISQQEQEIRQLNYELDSVEERISILRYNIKSEEEKLYHLGFFIEHTIPHVRKWMSLAPDVMKAVGLPVPPMLR
ncbi:MAG: hypothetical protein WCF65_07560 [Parachlamydiaceae bacterium]